MNVPWHLMPHTATVQNKIADGGFSVDYTGQAIPGTLDEGVELPCRITPLSGNDLMALGGEMSQSTHSGVFPSPAVIQARWGLTDFHIRGQALVTLDNGTDEVVYRVTGPASIQIAAHADILQRVYLETWNQERAPA